jgi:ABC-type transport system involved in multi-copper enzyme maturation permease subunit
MIPAIKSEFRKLLTVRSTYAIIAFALVLEGMFAFWANGVKADPKALLDSHFLQGQAIEAIGALGLIGAFVTVLLMTYEYRYNTITYTLTTTNRRIKVLTAKIIVASCFALVFSAVMAALSPLAVLLGTGLQGAHLAPQSISYAEVAWKVLFYGWGFGMAGLLIGALVRNQIAAIAGLLLIPGLIEQLLSFVLKNNQIYLPFRSIDAVIHPGVGSHVLTSANGAVVFSCYLVAGWIVALILFQKRDAN